MHPAKISNLLARSFIVFIIAYLWLTFYVRNIIVVFVIAFTIMMLVNFAFSMKKPIPKFHPYVANLRAYSKYKPPKIIWRTELKKFRAHLFQRRKVRSYIILGVILFLTSFIVRFNIYYLVFATVMFLFALASLFEVKSKDERTESKAANTCPLAWRDGRG